VLGKLISLIAQTKGAAITTLVVAGAATTTVVATNTDIQDALNNATSAVTTTLGITTNCVDEAAKKAKAKNEEAKGSGQPEVVAQRNAADKVLRAAHQDAQKALTDLRGGKDQDNKAAGDVIKTYDDKLKDTLETAINKVAALTQGREGQERKAEASASAAARSSSPSPTATGSPSPTPSCSPAPSASASPTGSASLAASASPTGSAAVAPAGSPGPSESPKLQGREIVAERTTLNPGLRAIVDQAINDMGDLVKKATDEVALIPASEKGKPSDKPGNSAKPDDKGKPSENPGGGNKPSNSPGRP